MKLLHFSIVVVMLRLPCTTVGSVVLVELSKIVESLASNSLLGSPCHLYYNNCVLLYVATVLYVIMGIFFLSRSQTSVVDNEYDK